MKNSSDSTRSVEELKETAKEYLKLCTDATKLRLIDNLSTVLNKILSYFVITLLLLVAIVFFALGLNQWLTRFISPIAAACLIGSVVLIACIVLFLCRNRLFINSLVRMLAKVFFQKESEKEGGEL